ncbi:MAG: nitrate/nitrite transporter NrtS [Acidobacteria bacterium]|nr:nitrate/nitrite transporter NrtS [Acidobacteriota bacterium]
MKTREWLQLATSRAVVRRACVVAVVVGTVLILINHGEALLHGEVSSGRALQIVLTALVPYCVSTFSSVQAMRDRAPAHPRMERRPL